VPSSGTRGLLEVFRYACPRLTLFAPSRSRALRKFPDGNFRRPLVKILRALMSAEMAALRGNAAARNGFFLAALHSVAKRVSRGQAYHPTRCVPVCPKTAPHASAATIRSFVPDSEPSRDVPGWKGSQDSVFWFLPGPKSRALFSQPRQMGTRCVASTRGPCGAGGRAFRGLTRSATEWSAARRKPLRAAAMHLSATISADVQARRLPTSERRKFPSAEIFEARATLREQSGSTLGRRVSASVVPVCYNEMRNVPITVR
jgi:hypothetical protein